VLGCCVFLFVVLLNLCFHLLFNIIGSSSAWFVSKKNTTRDAFRRSQAQSRQHQPTHATSGDQQGDRDVCHDAEWANGPGSIRAAESQGKFVDNSRGAGAPFPHRKDAITEGKIFRTWHWVTRIELDYDRSAELHYVIGLKD